MSFGSGSPKVTIRRFQPGDAALLAQLFHAAVHQIGSRHYSPEQVAAWSPAVPDPVRYLDNADDGRVFLVAADQGNRPVAYCDLEPDGHIDHLYCRPDCAGTGVSAALYRELEAIALKRHIPLLYVEASEAARRFLERRGFRLEARRDFEVNGVAIHNYRMTKSLDLKAQAASLP